MGQGGSKTQRVDIIDIYDPRVTGRAAPKGTLFRYIPVVGNPELLIKQDDGFTVNWANVSSDPTGITVVEAASTANVNVAVAPANLDGVVLVANDLVLLKDQTLAEENGVYQFNGAGVPLTRASEWNAAEEFIPGRQVFVDGGDEYADTMWALADSVAVLGVDPVRFIPISVIDQVVTPTVAASVANVNIAVAPANLDGVVLVANDLVLLKDQTLPEENGVYQFNGAGVPLTRATDWDFAPEFTAGRLVFVGPGGTVNADKYWGLEAAVANLGVDPVTFVQAGGAPIGTPDTIAYFNTLGVLSGNIQAFLREATFSIGFGIINAPATITSSGNGSQAHGESTDAGSDISSTNDGSYAHGRVATAGTIVSSGEGAHAHGNADAGAIITASIVGAHAGGFASGAGSTIQASGTASLAHGVAAAAGILRATLGGAVATGVANISAIIESTSGGSQAQGYATDLNSRLTASSFGAQARGFVGAGGVIEATFSGAVCQGYASGAGSVLQSIQEGAFVHGYALSAGIIRAGLNGSTARGHVDTSGVIETAGSAIGGIASGFATGAGSLISAGTAAAPVDGEGSIAHGYAEASGQITTESKGAVAIGYVSTAGAYIYSSSFGTIALGYATNGGGIEATTAGAFSVGSADGAGSIIQSQGQGTHAHGNVAGAALIQAISNGSHAFGNADTASIIRSAATGAHAFGNATGGAIISAAGIGSQASGRINGDATSNITSTGPGSHAFGYIDGNGNTINASAAAWGSFVHGVSLNAGTITSTARGAMARGYADNGQISANNNGSIASGYATGGGNVSTAGLGSHAFGYGNGGGINANGTGSFAQGSATSVINADGEGSFAGGYSNDGSYIEATATGSHAHGYVDGANSHITASGLGAKGGGYVLTGGEIIASGNASRAHGSASATFAITASGEGSYASGVTATGSITASGVGSFAYGDLLNVSGNYAASFGLGNVVSAYGCFVAGRYAIATGTAAAWVATDPAFVYGNGTGIGTESNAFALYKDGRIETTGAQVHQAIRAAVNPDTLSARTDRSLMVDTSVGGVAYVVNMPAGEEGLEYFIKDIGNNANVNNITFTPNGADVMQAGADITTAGGARHFQFFGGTWWTMGGVF